MKVLIACEFSGVVRDAFISRGHDAWSCDFLPTDKPGPHITGDVLEVIGGGWDLMVAHPPCTYLCNSGVCHLHKSVNRWFELFKGAELFKSLLESSIPKIAIENPIMHGYAKQLIGEKQTQVIQPWMFGHAEQKATCLWLKGLPKLKHSKNVKEDLLKLDNKQRQRLHHLPPSKDRWKIRSTTFQGIANAMAEQWGIDGNTTQAD